MFRTVMVAVAMCSATLATQAIACSAAPASEDRVCQAQAENSVAIVKFQKRIGGGGIHVQP
jgi:hypothetical protein